MEINPIRELDAALVAAWSHDLGQAVLALGAPDFPDALETALSRMAPFQMMNAFLYSREGRAHDLYNRRIVADRRIIVDQYLNGTYILDPFYDSARHAPETRFIMMRKLVPDLFTQSEYYRLHYAATGIIDEIGFVLALGGGNTGVLSLSRVGDVPLFSDHETQLLEQVAPLICALGAKHWSVPAARRPEPVAAPSFRHPALTDREQGIVALILKGHSSLSIAAHLSLSPETVKVHRRKIYAKLQISSQGELFRIFFAEHGAIAD